MKSLIVLSLLFSAGAHASFKLAEKKGEVTCYADDNQSWVLDADRSTVQYTVEGESLGAQEIVDIDSDSKTYISYRTDEGILTLGKKDTWKFAEEEDAWEIECK